MMNVSVALREKQKMSFVCLLCDMSEIILVRMCATYLLLFRLQKKSRNQNFLFKT